MDRRHLKLAPEPGRKRGGGCRHPAEVSCVPFPVAPLGEHELFARPRAQPRSGPRPTSENHVTAYRITLHARRKARALGLTIGQVHQVIDVDDVCETMPNATDDRIGKRVYGRVGAREFHVILVVNPTDSLHTVTTVYEVDRMDFPDGRMRRRKR